jgi:signal peptidase II
MEDDLTDNDQGYMKIYKYFLVALGVIIIDQATKLLVWKYMYLHQEVQVIGDWFRLHYLLNPGMAFGIRWNNEFGKLALTIFRIGAMLGIGYYLYRMAARKAHSGFLWCMGLILGGAIGNVIDSTFYGVFLENHPPESPTPWFHGQVIDMLYFPLFNFVWPDWVPLKGGEYFEFFSPVFNIADSSIFIGVVIILLFQRRFFKAHEDHDQAPVLASASVASVVEQGTPSIEKPADSIDNPPSEG